MPTIFNCPHCNQPITEAQLKNNESNWALIENFLQQHKQDYLQQLRFELKQEFNNQLNDKLALQEQMLLQDFNNQQHQLNMKLQAQELAWQNAQNNKNLEINNAVLNFKTTAEAQKNELIQNYEKRLNALTQANREFKIINSKTKGENFEHEVEEELRKAFGLFDSIEKLTVGDKKADYLQTIKNPQHETLGKIVYEVKNATWSNAWVGKLATDVANNKTKYGILIATSFNDKYHGIPFIKAEDYEHIWITDANSFIFVGQIVRRMIEMEYVIDKKAMEFSHASNDQIVKQLEAQKQRLEAYWTVEFPSAYKKVQKELLNLQKVSQSLDKNATKINKSLDVIKKQFLTNVTNSLTKILGKLNLDIESDIE